MKKIIQTIIWVALITLAIKAKYWIAVVAIVWLLFMKFLIKSIVPLVIAIIVVVFAYTVYGTGILESFIF